MTDPYANIRRALEMRPTPGPWKKVKDKWGVRVDAAKNPHGDPFGFGIAGDIQGDRRGDDATGGTPDANAAHIAACDPDTIRALLAERDALMGAARIAATMRLSDWLNAGGTVADFDKIAAIAAANGGGNG